MRVHFTMIGGYRSQVHIDCVGDQSDLEVLKNNTVPLSSASLILVDGLAFI